MLRPPTFPRHISERQALQSAAKKQRQDVQVTRLASALKADQMMEEKARWQGGAVRRQAPGRAAPQYDGPRRRFFIEPRMSEVEARRKRLLKQVVRADEKHAEKLLLSVSSSNQSTGDHNADLDAFTLPRPRDTVAPGEADPSEMQVLLQNIVPSRKPAGERKSFFQGDGSEGTAGERRVRESERKKALREEQQAFLSKNTAWRQEQRDEQDRHDREFLRVSRAADDRRRRETDAEGAKKKALLQEIQEENRMR